MLTQTSMQESESRAPLPFWAVLLSLLAVIALLFGRSLSFGYTLDDADVLHSIHDWTPTARLLNYWRPLWALWLSLLHLLFGAQPQAIHAVGLIIHLLNALLAYHILKRVGISPVRSLVIVAFWTAFSGNAFPIAWISACNDLVGMTFLLSGTLLWMTAVRRHNPSIGLAVVAVSVWLIGLFAKEVSLAWPALMVVGTTVARRQNRVLAASDAGAETSRASFFKLVILYVLPFLGLAVLLLARYAVLGPGLGFDTYKTGSSVLKNESSKTVIIGKIIHFGEGLFSSFLPLDLFETLPKLAVGAAVVAVFMIVLLCRLRTASSKPWLLIVAAIAWWILFSLHTTAVPEARTLYVPTLGVAALIVMLMPSIGEMRSKPIVTASLTAFVIMHIMLGQRIIDSLSPRSSTSTIYAAQVLRSSPRPVEPDVREVLINQLDGYDRAILEQRPLEHRSAWRLFAQEQFVRMIRKPPATQPGN